MTRPQGRHRLPPIAVIAIAQLFGTSLWFSANSAAEGLMQAWGATAADIGLLTNAVQAGFIVGTLVMALGGLADRFAASAIFVVSALAGAAFNLGFAWLAQDVATGAGFRFLVGLSLAGIYPIGMKMIVSWAPSRSAVSSVPPMMVANIFSIATVRALFTSLVSVSMAQSVPKKLPSPRKIGTEA